ncbi:MAG: hypothetical protein AAF495_01095 [Pseudomonadota bacterium]
MALRYLTIGVALLWGAAASAGSQEDAFWDHLKETAPACAHFAAKHNDLTRRAEAAFKAGDVAGGNALSAQRIQNDEQAWDCVQSARQSTDGSKGLTRKTGTSGSGGIGKVPDSIGGLGTLGQNVGCGCGVGGGQGGLGGGGGIGSGSGCGCGGGVGGLGGLGGASWATRLKRALTPHLGGGVGSPGRAGGGPAAGACGCGGGQLGGLQGFYPFGGAAPAGEPPSYVAHASCDSQALRDAGMEVAAPVPGREGKECFWAEGAKSLDAEELRQLQLEARRTAAKRAQNCRCAAGAIEDLTRQTNKNAAQSGTGVQKQIDGVLRD